MAKDTVAEIKDRLSIQDIIAPYVKLTRAGRSLRGLCPFHKEKTPSFHVSPERGSWHCFGCGEGGDGFSFIQKVEGVEFKGALKILAEKAGVTIEYSQGPSREDATKKERLLSLMSRASQWYAGQFPGSPAEAYAKKRSLSEKSIAAWGLGFAPEAWRALLEALTAEGFTIEELLSAGLIKEADGKPGTYYDRFRNRLMFPIRDAAGRVVAFTGRALAADELAKYLNSPETELYHKSEILYGMDAAKEAIRTRKFTLLVEGQIDVLLAHQSGFENAVALSGTALSEKHLSLMKRYSDNLMFALDADPAGLSSTAKSSMFALKYGLRVKAARLPSGKDPADLIAEDPPEFKKRIAAAKPVVEFFLAELTESEKDQHRLLRASEAVVLPLISAIASPMEREHFVQSTARMLGLSAEAVRESLARLPVQKQTMDTAPITAPSLRNTPQSPRQIREGMVLAAVHAYPGSPLAERLKTEYCRITEAKQFPSDEPSESALFTIEQTFGEEPSKEAGDELLHAFEESVIREAYQSAVHNLRRAEAAGDAAMVADAQALCARLSSRLGSFGS